MSEHLNINYAYFTIKKPGGNDVETIVTATDNEIRDFIRSLHFSLGGIKSLPDSTTEELRSLYDSGEFSECIRKVKHILKLNDLTLRICYINEHCKQESLRTLLMDAIKKMGYTVSQSALAKDLTDAGALILQPRYFPLYGTREFTEMKILMFIFRRIVRTSLEIFIYSISHELSHVILAMSNHPLRNNEVAVDLTAMILGFSDIIRIGRKSESIASCGYLDDRQFKLAYEEIQRRKKIIHL
ncbi:MAG: hypothetical protein Q8L10_00370 [Candidatus Moranbacteria bacterium]|nr:hypothetical protein [Candidatus Moranbacteria bacterium]